MDRDPRQVDITRDPIYLVQEKRRQWVDTPQGCEWDDGCLMVKDSTDLDSWLPEFVDEETQTINLTPEFYEAALNWESSWFTEYWDTISVFLTRDEAETWAAARAYRWEQWRVYCIPCDGQLARILKALPDTPVLAELPTINLRWLLAAGELRDALTELLVQLREAEEDTHPETGEMCPSVQEAYRALTAFNNHKFAADITPPRTWYEFFRNAVAAVWMRAWRLDK